MACFWLLCMFMWYAKWWDEREKNSERSVCATILCHCHKQWFRRFLKLDSYSYFDVFICWYILIVAIVSSTSTHWQNGKTRNQKQIIVWRIHSGKFYLLFFISILLLLLLWRRTHTQSQATARFTSCESNRNTLLSSLIALTVVFSFTLSVVWCVRMESTLINTGPRFLFLPTKKIMSHSHLK